MGGNCKTQGTISFARNRQQSYRQGAGGLVGRLIPQQPAGVRDLEMEYQEAAIVSADVDLQPYTTLEKGERGIITKIYRSEDGIIWGIDVLMDKHHAGLAYWDNHAHLVEPELSQVTPAPSKPHIVRRIAALAAGLFTPIAWKFFKQA